ncbi:hypothetical protein Tco_0540239 [Tanacetum coccineum]
MQQSPPNNNFVPQPSFNTNYMQQPMLNPDEINDPITAMNMALIAQPGQFAWNQNRYNAIHNAGNQVMQNPVQNPGIQKVGNQNGLIIVQGITKQNENGNVVAARAEGNGNENNGNQIRCYNCKGVGDIEEIESAEVHQSKNSYNNEIFNMFTQEEQYTELLEPNTEQYPIQQNNSNVISGDLNVGHNGGIIDQNRATVEETRAYFESLYNNLVIEVKKVNTINRKMCEANAELTTKLSRYKGNEKCFEINQEKYAKLERCYQKSVYQERCLTKKINALQLSSPKTITTLDEEIENLNNQLSKEKATIYYLQEERKKLKTDFKKREHEFLDKQIQVFVSQKAKSREEFYFKNISKTASVSNSVSKQIKIPDDEFSDNASSPSVARKFINEFQKILKDEIAPIVNQVDARVQNFEIQLLKEAAKFVRDFKSLAKEADESLDKNKIHLQTELDRTKEKLETCIIKKEKEYVVLWNNWYKNVKNVNMTRFRTIKPIMICKIKSNTLYLKGTSRNTQCASYTLDPLSQKLDDENIRAQTKLITDSLQEKLTEKIYENAMLRAQLHTKFSEQQNQVKGTSANTKFAKLSILGKPPLKFLRNQSVVRQPNAFKSERPKFPKTRFIPKVVENIDLTNSVTSHSVPKCQESKVVKNDKVISPGMSRMNPLKNSRIDNFVPNKHAKASVRTKPITVSQPHVITKKDVNSNTNGLPSTIVESTTKTRRPQPRSNPKNGRIPSASKSSCLSNNLEKVEEHHRNLLFSKTPNHRSSEGNNIKLAIRNDKSEVICATCKQCLITATHDECVFKYANNMNSSKKNQSANVSESANQKIHKPNVKKSKKLGSEERLDSPRLSKPRTSLRWLPTGRIFDLCGKLTTSSNTESEFDTSVCDNASASNPQEPTSKGFPNSTSFLDRFTRL